MKYVGSHKYLSLYKKLTSEILLFGKKKICEKIAQRIIYHSEIVVYPLNYT